MPENEFEKQVQQKMEGLKFTPADEVWKEVAYRIRKEKKKKRIFFWLPLLGLALGGGLAAIWLTNNNEHKVAQSDKNEIKLQPNSPGTQKQSESDASFLKENNKENNIKKNRTGDSISKENNDNAEKKSFQRDKQEMKSKEGELTQFASKESTHRNIIAKNKTTRQNKDDVAALKNQDIQPVIDTEQKNSIVSKGVIVNEKNNRTEIQNQKSYVNNDSAVTAPALKDEIVTKKPASDDKIIEQKIQKQEPAEIMNDSTGLAANQKKQPIRLNKKTKKWQWGIMAEKGKSYTAKGIRFSDDKSGANNLYSNPSQSPGSLGYISSSAIHPSGSFGTGIIAKLPVSSKLDVNFSLGYLYLSTKMNVGNRMDSLFVVSNFLSSSLTVDNFYRASNNNSSYTNRYHFLNFSAELSWKIIDSKKISLYWNNGFSYNRLLSSNALHFDRNLPGYYKDFRLLTHNHFFLSTGFTIPVFKRFEINPFAEYSLTPVLRTGSDSLQLPHFTNYGIRIKFLLTNR
jgi:hypothetical protein